MTRFIVAVWLGLVGGAALAEEPLWNLAELRKAPKVEWLDTTGDVRRLHYESEPRNGKPTRVYAVYAEPAGPGKKPAIVLVHGGGGKAFPEWAKLWAARGYVALAMDLGGHGEDGKRLPDGGPDQDDASKLPAKAMPLRDVWTYHAVAAVLRGASLLQSLPNVDADKLAVTGISWGGYLTCIIAGVDDRFKAAVPVYGCGYLTDNSVWLKQFAAMELDWKKQWRAKFDPAAYLRRAKMPMLFVNGTNDFAYPLDSYQKSYRLVSTRTLTIIPYLPHGHPQGWAPVEIGIFINSVLLGKPPLPATPEPMVKSTDGKTVLTVAILQTPGKPQTVEKVQLHWTTDTVKPWQQRKWETREATKMPGNATDFFAVEMPTDRPLIYFVTATDTRKATVSSPHATLEK